MPDQEITICANCGRTYQITEETDSTVCSDPCFREYAHYVSWAW